MSKKNLLVLFGLVATTPMFPAENQKITVKSSSMKGKGFSPRSYLSGETSGIGVFSVGEVLHNAGAWRIFYGETHEGRYLSRLPKGRHLQQWRRFVDAQTAGRILPEGIIACGN